MSSPIAWLGDAGVDAADIEAVFAAGRWYLLQALPITARGPP